MLLTEEIECFLQEEQDKKERKQNGKTFKEGIEDVEEGTISEIALREENREIHMRMEADEQEKEGRTEDEDKEDIFRTEEVKQDEERCDLNEQIEREAEREEYDKTGIRKRRRKEKKRRTKNRLNLDKERRKINI